MNRKRIVIICPGRGSYTRETQGYLNKYKEPHIDKINYMDKQRLKAGLTSLTDLDTTIFKSNIHMKGENASTLIYASSLIDYHSIDQSKYKIVGIIGNSMGWYSTLAFSQSLDYQSSYALIDTMGSMMKDNIIGGQIIYSIIDDNWKIDNDLKEKCQNEINKVGAQISIYLGGYLVIGAEQTVLNKLLKILPKNGKYPFQLPFHAAFHTSLLESISQKAKSAFSSDIFFKPKIPIIDGRGHIWSPWSTNEIDLYNYTLGHQVYKPFNFTKSLTVAMKELSPDNIVLLGPENQKNRWQFVYPYGLLREPFCSLKRARGAVGIIIS